MVKKTAERKSKRKYAIMAAIAALAIFIAVGASYTKLVTVRYTHESGKLKNTVHIALITDLHSCYYGEGQKDLLDAVYSQNPGIVLLGGDIVDDVLPQQNALFTLKELAKRYPCYYVSGNHEFWSGEIYDIKQKIRDCGVTVLEGECKTIVVSGQRINICGIDDAEIGEIPMFGQLEEAFDEASVGAYTVLLAHRPEYIRNYLKYGFDLILSGHAHGGQWRLPDFENGLIAPNQGLFPKYSGGEYSFGDTLFIVSRGLARESTRIPRVFNPPELVIIDIKGAH